MILCKECHISIKNLYFNTSLNKFGNKKMVYEKYETCLILEKLLLKKSINYDTEELIDMFKIICEFDNKSLHYRIFIIILKKLARILNKHELTVYFMYHEDIHSAWLEHMSMDNSICYINYKFIKPNNDKKLRIQNYVNMFNIIREKQIFTRNQYYILMLDIQNNYKIVENNLPSVRFFNIIKRLNDDLYMIISNILLNNPNWCFVLK